MHGGDVVAGTDTTRLVAQHQIARADQNGDGRLDRREFVAFSLPAFASFDFGAATHLLNCFVEACTKKTTTAEEMLLHQCVGCVFVLRLLARALLACALASEHVQRERRYAWRCNQCHVATLSC